MNKEQTVSFILGLLSGAAVGALMSTLWAPQSGPQTRQTISDKVNEIIQSGKQARDERRQALEQEYMSRIQIPLSDEPAEIA